MTLLKEINNMMMLTPSRHLDEAIPIKNRILNMTCENCKYYKLPDHDMFNKKDCANNENGQNVIICPPPTFGCNKFERKEQK